MRRLAAALAFAGAVFAASAALAAPPDPAAELAARDRAFDQASRERGVAAWVEFFADDAVVFPGRGPFVRGKEAIRAAWAKAGFDPAGLSWFVDGAEVSAAGDFGVTYGHWRAERKGPDGKPAVATGKYLTTWRKGADGVWRVIADIGAPDAP